MGLSYYREPFFIFFDLTDWDFGFGFGWDKDMKMPEFRLYLGPVFFSIDWV